MNNIINIININEYWKKTKDWFDNVKVEKKNIFPYEKFKDKKKNAFYLKFKKILYKIFNIPELEYFTKDSVSKITYDDLKNNIFKYQNKIIKLLNFDPNLVDAITYLSQYTEYYPLLKDKVKKILKPIYEEENLLNNDDDYNRLIIPISFIFLYIYFEMRDLKKSILLFLESDIIYIQFFIVSYLILDDIMDDEDINKDDKNFFMKWFLNIVNNPNEKIKIPINNNNNNNNNNIYNKCILFKKYFELFNEVYDSKENEFIYEYIKYMINILQESGKYQKSNNNVNEEKILEYTYKKSFVVSYFLIYFCKIEIKEKTLENLSKLILLSQLLDDFNDIQKDKKEKNYTYFNMDNIDNNNFLSNEKIKKLIYASIDYINIFDEKNKDIKNIIDVFVKYNLYILLFSQYENIDKTTIKEILEYQILPNNVIQLMIKKQREEFKNEYIFRLIKKFLT